MRAVVARKKVREMPPKSTPVRLSEEAVKWARIASGYTGESMAAYVSRVIVERGQEDAAKLHAQMVREGKPGEGKPPKK